jgi:hypothetical protein
VNFLFFPQHPFAWTRHLGIMAALLALCVTLVINVPDIREIFGFVGKVHFCFTFIQKRIRRVCFWLPDFHPAIIILHQDPARR